MGEAAILFAMAEQLSREDLVELRKKLATMSITGLKDFYFAAHWHCQLQDGKIPEARFIQELVQVWKEMRKLGSR